MKEHIRILHLSSEKGWRGGEQQIAYLIEGLQQKGIINIIACRNGSAFEKYCVQNHRKYYGLPFKNSFDLKTINAIRKICSKEHIDLIHIHSAKSHSLAVLSHVIGNRSPMILSRRVDFPIRNSWFTRWKYNHHAICSILCVSNAIERIVRSSIKEPDKCTTVYSGIDLSKFKRPSGYLRKAYHLSENTLLIGNTSALAAHKDYVTFVDTAAVFLQYQIAAHFFIIGDGPEKEAIQQYIKQKGLTDHITLTGFLSNIDEILPELDIFLMTSTTEGLGTSVLDAFACKIPVVATKAGGIPEMVIHQQTGLLAKVKNSPALAAHIKALVENSLYNTTLTEQAYQHLINRFTKEKMTETTLEIYLDSIKQSS